MSHDTDLHPESAPSGSKLVPALLAVVALGLFFLTGIKAPETGLPAKVLTATAGLESTPSTSHALYLILANLCAKILPGDLLANLNLFSAFFGALCVFLLYGLAEKLPYFSSADDRRRHRRIEMRAAQVGAVATCSLLIFSTPFWSSSSMPANFTFDLFLLLLPFTVLVRALNKSSGRSLLFTAAFLYGICATEYPSAFLVAPLFLLVVLIVLVKRADLTALTISTLVLSGLLGCTFYLLPVLRYYAMDGLASGQFDNAWEVLVDVWKKQYHEARGGIPNVGFLLIFLTCFGPWGILVAMAHPKRARAVWIRISSFLSLTLLVALGITILLDQKISPMRFASGTGMLLPYLSLCGWMGYIAGYWFLYAKGSHAIQKASGLEKLLGLTMTAMLLAAGPAVGILNFNRVDRSHASYVAAMAQHIVASLEGETFLFSNGTPMDDLIRLHAWEQGRQIEILSVRNLTQQNFRRYLARKYPDIPFNPLNPETISSFILGLVGTPAYEGKLAVADPEFATALGLQAIPNGLLYHPARNFDGLNPEAIHAKNLAYFSKVIVPHVEKMKLSDFPEKSKLSLSAEYSKSANNLGALMTFLKKPALAMDFYNLAIDLQPLNPSTHLNIREHHLAALRAATSDEEKKSCQAAAEASLAKAQEVVKALEAMEFKSLNFSRHFGMICSEQLSLLAAKQFQLSGNLQSGSAALTRATALSPDSEDVRLRTAIQAMDLGRAGEALSIYSELLNKDPGNAQARLSAATTLFADGKPADAITMLEAHPHQDDTSIKAFLALLMIEQGQEERGRAELAKINTSTVADAQTFAYLAYAYSRLGEHQLTEHCVGESLRLSPENIHLYHLLIKIADQNGDARTALRYYEKIAEANPTHIPTLEKVISYNMALNQPRAARVISDRLLSLDPYNFLAAYVLSRLAMDEAQYDQMERYLRICVQHTKDPRYDVAANNIAYALLQLGRSGEALAFAKESVIMNPSNSEFQHTLAEVLLAEKEIEAARSAIGVALAKAPEKAKHKAVLAEVLYAANEKAEAARLASEIISTVDEKYRARLKSIINP